MHVPKTVRNTAISIVVLVVIFVAFGAIYVLISGRSTAKPVSAAPKAPEQSLSIPKPRQPNPKAPESASAQSLVSPVKAGSNSSIAVRTNAGSACTISVIYNGVASKDSGLSPKTADEYGNVTWAWTVDVSATPGNWPVTVTCNFHGRSAVVIANLQVVKK